MKKGFFSDSDWTNLIALSTILGTLIFSVIVILSNTIQAWELIEKFVYYIIIAIVNSYFGKKTAENILKKTNGDAYMSVFNQMIEFNSRLLDKMDQIYLRLDKFENKLSNKEDHKSKNSNGD
jgi:predicted LPLAT superfamily acyltransferase